MSPLLALPQELLNQIVSMSLDNVPITTTRKWKPNSCHHLRQSGNQLRLICRAFKNAYCVVYFMERPSSILFEAEYDATTDTLNAVERGAMANHPLFLALGSELEIMLKAHRLYDIPVVVSKAASYLEKCKMLTTVRLHLDIGDRAALARAKATGGELLEMVLGDRQEKLVNLEAEAVWMVMKHHEEYGAEEGRSLELIVVGP